MKNEDGISVFPAISKLRDQRKFLYSRSTEFFVFAIDRTFLSSRSTEFWNFAVNGILEFCDRRNFCIHDCRNFVIFVIDRMFNARDRRNFLSSRSTEFLFLPSTNQAIESSDCNERWTNQAIKNLDNA